MNVTRTPSAGHHPMSPRSLSQPQSSQARFRSVWLIFADPQRKNRVHSPVCLPRCRGIILFQKTSVCLFWEQKSHFLFPETVFCLVWEQKPPILFQKTSFSLFWKQIRPFVFHEPAIFDVSRQPPGKESQPQPSLAP